MNLTNLILMSQNGSEQTDLDCPESLAHHTDGWKYSFITSYSFTVLLSILGNILVLGAIYRNSKLRTTVHIFIANMAVSDVLGAIFLAPVRLSNILDVPFPLTGTFGSIMCPLSPFIADSSFAVSILSIMVIAAERFQAVVFPRERALPSTQYRRLTIFTIWFIAFAFYSLYFFTRKLVSEDGEIFCDIIWEPPLDPVISPKVYSIVNMVIFWAIPAVLLAGMYVTVLICLKRQGETFRSMASLERQRDRQIRDQNISTMLITIIVVFYLTWSPMTIFAILKMSSPDILRNNVCHHETLDFVFSLMVTTNTAINPFIYFILNKTYRRGMMQLMLIVCPYHKICCSKLRAKLDLRERTNTDASVQSARSRVSSRIKSEVVMTAFSSPTS